MLISDSKPRSSNERERSINRWIDRQIDRSIDRVDFKHWYRGQSGIGAFLLVPIRRSDASSRALVRPRALALAPLSSPRSSRGVHGGHIHRLRLQWPLRSAPPAYVSLHAPDHSGPSASRATEEEEQRKKTTKISGFFACFF